MGIILASATTKDINKSIEQPYTFYFQDELEILKIRDAVPGIRYQKRVLAK